MEDLKSWLIDHAKYRETVERWNVLNKRVEYFD